MSHVILCESTTPARHVAVRIPYDICCQAIAKTPVIPSRGDESSETHPCRGILVSTPSRSWWHTPQQNHGSPRHHYFQVPDVPLPVTMEKAFETGGESQLGAENRQRLRYSPHPNFERDERQLVVSHGGRQNRTDRKIRHANPLTQKFHFPSDKREGRESQTGKRDVKAKLGDRPIPHALPELLCPGRLHVC